MNPLTATKERVRESFAAKIAEVYRERYHVLTAEEFAEISVVFLNTALDSIAVEVLGLVEGLLPEGRLHHPLDRVLEMRMADLEATGKSQLDVDAGYNTCLTEIAARIQVLKNSLTEKV